MRHSNERLLASHELARTKEQKAFFRTLQRAALRIKTFKAKCKKVRLYTNVRRSAPAAKQIQYKAFVAAQCAETNRARGAIRKNL